MKYNLDNSMDVQRAEMTCNDLRAMLSQCLKVWEKKRESTEYREHRRKKGMEERAFWFLSFKIW